MAVTFSPTEPLQGTLTIHITDTEFQPLLAKQLADYKNKAQLKGFRKGKTSIDLIKKLYGSAILQEVIENNLQKQLMDHIRDHKLNLLGQPIGNADQPQISYDIFNPSEFKFLFDIGFVNEFEIKGLDKPFNLNKVQIETAKVDEQFENIRRRMGELKETDGPVTADHLLAIKAVEIENGEIKKGGVAVDFSLWLSQIDEAAKNLFIDKKKADTVDADIRSFHPDKDEAFLKSRYFTDLGEETSIPSLLRFTISEIKTMVPAEVNQEFFDKAFGEEVDSEEKAKDKIKGELEHQFLHQSEALLFRDVQDHLLKENKMDMPDAFLKRWLKVQDPRLSEEALEDEYPDFTLNLLWTLLRDKLIGKYNIEIKAQDIRHRMRQQFMSYLGGMNYLGDMSFLDNIIDKQMKNREQVEKLHDEILTDRLFDQLKGDIKIEEVSITEPDFVTMMEAARKDSAERRKKTNHHHHHDHDHSHHDHDHDHDYDHKH